MRVFKKLRTAAKFTIELRDHLGIVRRFSGLTDRRQTEQMGRRIEALVECRSARGGLDLETSRWLENAPPALKARLADVGIIDGARVSAARPLGELLKGFTRHLEAKERTTQYVRETGSMLGRVFDECRFVVWSDITPSKVETCLKQLRIEGLSIGRSNGYLTAVKTFCRWMADSGQATESPVRSLRKLNEKTDVRRPRRAATPDELRKLITTTAASGESFGMAGAERSLLYWFCAESGLRAKEARTLTAGDFDLDGLTVSVRAAYSKHREIDTVPLRADLAEALRGHLKGKLPTGKVFGGRYRKLTHKTAEMLRQDAEAAGVAYIDERGYYLDFHALRHSFITGLRDAPSRVAQNLARHKSSAQTDRYTHIRLNDERAALAMLPDLKQKPSDERAKATGTDNAIVTDQQLNTTDRVHSPESGARGGALHGTNPQNSLQLGANKNRIPAVENAVSGQCRRVSNAHATFNQHVAYLEAGLLKVRELASQSLVAEWHVPFDTWRGPAWSTTGRELWPSVGGNSLGDRTGLWIYSLDSKEPAKVLSAQILAASSTPDGTKLVFGLRPPDFELWTADLDPARSVVQALGPGQTLDEHWEQMLRLYTRRIKADPQDAYAYSDRARYYDYRQERTETDADMRRWSAVMSGRSPSDSWFGRPDGFRRAVSLPFDCELVFSAERPVNAIPTMSIAFGQKGRCEMKLAEIPMAVMSLFVFCVLSGPATPTAHADFIYGEPTNLGPMVNNADPQVAPYLSPDGRELYFLDGANNVTAVARRATPDSEWGPASAPGLPFRPSSSDHCGCITPDGLTLLMSSGRPGGCGGMDLWMSTRATTDTDWDTPSNLGAVVNSAHGDCFPCVSADGLELYFMSDRPGGIGLEDLYLARRATVNDAWSTPVNLSVLNTPTYDSFPSISPDGLLLFFTSQRAEGHGGGDIYVASRATREDSWGPPMNCGPVVNTPSVEWAVSVSADGSMLYFHSNRPGGFGGFDVWQAPIIRVIDFNGDGKVDATDLMLLMDNWGKSTTLCDVGPFAWGDGVVDEKDLGILMEALVTPKPKTAEVPCDVVLSWISPSLTPACDVYLGTSREAVSTADRANPQGVLVRQGQTGTTCAPEGPLEFSQTYYWRVDFVIPGATPVTYRGPVLEFTTAGLTYAIKNITATASTMQPGSGPEKTVDGSGLDKNDGHSISAKDMWWSTGAGPNWIQYEFDRIYHLHELWVWNFNTMLDPFMGFGAKTVKIEYSTDGTAWTALASVPEFARATGKAGYTANTKITFGGLAAKFVKLTIEKNWGVAPQTGLSEVRFFATQSAGR